MRRGDAALALAGWGLFEGSRILAVRRRLDPLEVRLFRAANGASDDIRVPVRAAMQMGTFATVPAVSAVLWRSGRRRLAAEVGAAGTAAWLLAKAAKPLAGRPRPGSVLGGVITRESIAGDLGWVSGHVAVSISLGLALWPVTPRAGRGALVGLMATTAFGRMYVGAHLPLDLVGGAGLGMMCVVGVRRALALASRPSPPSAARSAGSARPRTPSAARA
jgi:membrane-associated phospholipid phosphatase